MTRIVLASASPRRRALLGQLGLAFDVAPVDLDETPLPDEAAEDLVRRLAVAKAQAGLAACDDDDVVVIGSDTTVAVGEEILGKPVDDADAERMLRLLSGTHHRVLTGVAVAARRAGGGGGGDDGDGGGKLQLGPAASLHVTVAVTDVHMRTWSDEEIEAYVASGEPRDKAGAYAIQETADRFVVHLDGGFDTVVGLPVAATARLLREAGVAVPGASTLEDPG